MPSTNGATAGRNGNGTFSKGNTFGQGNPHFRKVAGLRKALLDAVLEEDIAAIIQQMITAAKAGDIQAAKFVLSYAVGQPDKQVNPDDTIHDERQKNQREAYANRMVW